MLANRSDEGVNENLTVDTATNASSAPAALETKRRVKRRKHVAKTARTVKVSVTPKIAARLA